MLLSGSIADLQKNFIISKQDAWFVLKPRSKHGMFQNIQLRFVKDKLTTMRILDNLGQHSTINFSKIRINPIINPNLFKFKAGPGVDVVEN